MFRCLPLTPAHPATELKTDGFPGSSSLARTFKHHSQPLRIRSPKVLAHYQPTLPPTERFLPAIWAIQRICLFNKLLLYERPCAEINLTRILILTKKDKIWQKKKKRKEL